MCVFLAVLPTMYSGGAAQKPSMDFRVCVLQRRTVTPRRFAAQCLWVRASDWKHQASVIKFLKSNKRKFTGLAWLRSALGRASLCVPGSAGQICAAQHGGEDKPGERKGGISQGCFKTRSSELQICYGKKEVLIVSHPSLFTAQSLTVRTLSPAAPSWRRWCSSPPPRRSMNKGWDSASRCKSHPRAAPFTGVPWEITVFGSRPNPAERARGN